MIDFSTLQGVTIPEGIVTQIVDSVGRVIWKPKINIPIILRVEKIIGHTHSGSQGYPDEQFLILDIYPKTNGTVTVTYGGLTKTIKDTSGAANPNAIQVVFGTLYGTVHDTTSPTSGELIIEGDYNYFDESSYQTDKSSYVTAHCVIEVMDTGSITNIPNLWLDGSKITNITFGEAVQSIGEGVLMSSKQLYSISIPASVTHIGNNFCRYCNNLTYIYVDQANKYYFSDGFVLFDKEKTNLIKGSATITNYTIPSSVTHIGKDAFSYSKLTSITIPSNVTHIGEDAFRPDRNQANLKNINIADGVQYIGDWAFSDQVYATSITIPASVTYIGTGAFYISRSYQRTIIMQSPTPPEIGSDTAFGVIGSTTIIVPAGCGNAYKTASEWSEHADYIKEG